VTIPPHENIVVSHQPSDDRSHVHVEVAIKDAFAAARRQIEALAQRASGKVKLHELEAHGRVSKISAKEGYGFIATSDRREIYFHRNRLGLSSSRVVLAQVSTRLNSVIDNA
jgi:hypothetical protein